MIMPLLCKRIDLILETVLCNTLKYNKFTTAKEIFDNQKIKNIDIYTIEYICDAPSLNDRVLIKFINGQKPVINLIVKYMRKVILN
jgi:hypothetical protein